MSILPESWKLPSELDQPIPRQVTRLSVFGFNFRVALGVFFGVWAFLVVIIYFVSFVHFRKIEEHGIITSATISSVYIIKKRRRVVCGIDYSFQSDTGRLIYKNGSGDGMPPCNHKVGDSIPIIYLPGEPAGSRPLASLEDSKHSLFALYMGLAAFFPAITGLAIILTVIRQRREVDLLRYGHATQGRIRNTEIRRKRYRRILRVFYVYRDAYGKTHEHHRDFELASGDSGASILERVYNNTTVLYYPDNPSSAFLYPSDLVICSKNDKPKSEVSGAEG